jgi:FeS assembly SUF system protein
MNTETQNPIDKLMLENSIVEALRTVYDPEIPVNIYEMGLIYDILIDDTNSVNIRMTLTSPACPAAQSLPAEVEQVTRRVEGVRDVQVDVVWDPPYSMDMMSEAAKLELGFF